MSKPPPPAPTASAIGPCPTVIKIVGRPGTGSLPSIIAPPDHPQPEGGGRVVRWSWVNFQCRGVLLVLIRVGQGPTALAVGAGGGCLDIFTLVYPFFPFSPSLWETTRYRLKYCLKGSLSPNQPTNPARRRRQHHERQSAEAPLELSILSSPTHSTLLPSATSSPAILELSDHSPVANRTRSKMSRRSLQF